MSFWSDFCTRVTEVIASRLRLQLPPPSTASDERFRIIAAILGDAAGILQPGCSSGRRGGVQELT